MVSSCRRPSFRSSIHIFVLPSQYRGKRLLGCLSKVDTGLILPIVDLPLCQSRLHRILLRIVQYLNESLMTLVFRDGPTRHLITIIASIVIIKIIFMIVSATKDMVNA